MQNNVDLAFYKKGLQCVRAAFFSNKLLLIHTRLIWKEKKNGFLNPSRVLSLQVMSFLGYLLRATSFVYIHYLGFQFCHCGLHLGFSLPLLFILFMVLHLTGLLILHLYY